MKSIIFLSLFGALVSAVPTYVERSNIPSKAAVATTTAAASCSPTATLIDSLCDYPVPPNTFVNAVATDGPEYCWQACREHPTCNFVIFRQGILTLPGIQGPGTCWLYPSIKYAPKKGKKCTGTAQPFLFVYDKPTCAPPPPPKPTCSPTAALVDSLCDYPVPPNSFVNAVASDGPEYCWQACWEHPVCNFVIYRKGIPTLPGITGPGTCWLYPSIKYAPSKGKKCTGSDLPYLFVYNAPTCAAPKPPCDTTPALVDSVCDYPPPPDAESFAIATDGPELCQEECQKNSACQFTIYRKGTNQEGIAGPGTCWIYHFGERYDATKAGKCNGNPFLFVYEKPVCAA
ncbi:hypothetical protein TWF694_001224 [Orbilia ellipsospora]|uniref:Apple domain-containing protein n=1 Tax=Orbilia ellipsospora TaxID=2528407 RepID=A0AAV9XRE2_9PEZI